ncbi:heme exporter protein CcmB [Kaustia mangrovi]|uniref:Heme exporter protein B n=1 Tax=Kaustia mangrovi TaxID=2593653 RepID=A0A7S8C2S8_9HYPH|nr:heme exporter protein CcmB [Kaustia mangrovi]QPC42325.1 heme exporter protein CcmB [Kaustia mangrovi]
MSMFAAIAARDIRLVLRQGGGVGTAIGFFLTVVVLVPLGIGPDLQLLSRIAPGMLWIALLLSVLLSADRIFQADYEDGSLELMSLGLLPLELVVLAKALAHWVTTVLPLAIAAPVLGLLLNLHPSLFLTLGAAMIAGSAALSLLAAVGAAVTVGLRRGGLIVSILILPLYVPVLVFGLSATAGATVTADMFSASMLILVALALAALVLCPIAAAAALRAHFH